VRAGLPAEFYARVSADAAAITEDNQLARRLSSVGESALLIDVDLRDISKVKTIKDNLPRRSRDHCRIVAIDRTSHLSAVQGHGLGATDLLKRPFDVRELTQILHRHFGLAIAREGSDPKLALENAPGDASVALAAAALEGLFATLICGGALRLKEIANAGDQVIDAIAEIGPGQWLDAVRNCHEGTFQHCHPVIGYEYLATQDSVPQDVMDAVRHHHEYLDGSCYPDGLQGNQIKDLTRILTVYDVYGALIERRAYKVPKAPAVAMDILTNMANEGKVEADLVRALGHSVSASAQA
jgi:HD domain